MPTTLRKGGHGYWFFQQAIKHAQSLPEIIEPEYPLTYYTERLIDGIMSQLPATVQKEPHNQASHISRVSKQAMEAFGKAQSSDDFEASIQVARYIDELRTSIRPHMPDIMKLCDSPVGFRTDRSPAILEANRKKNKGPTEPYPESLVLECAVEALLRGVKLVGDQFNIISGRSYIPLNGYKYLINSAKAHALRYTISKISISDAEHVAEGKAVWIFEGKTYEMTKRFYCKAHGYHTTWEQSEGKATRKLLKAVYERITNRAFHDEDEGVQEESIDIEAAVVEGNEGQANEEPSTPAAPKPAEPNQRDLASLSKIARHFSVLNRHYFEHF